MGKKPEEDLIDLPVLTMIISFFKKGVMFKLFDTNISFECNIMLGWCLY